MQWMFGRVSGDHFFHLQSPTVTSLTLEFLSSLDVQATADDDTDLSRITLRICNHKVTTLQAIQRGMELLQKKQVQQTFVIYDILEQGTVSRVYIHVKLDSDETSEEEQSGEMSSN